VLTVLPSVLQWLFGENVNVVVEPDTGGFVIVDQSTLAANALNKPDCSAVEYEGRPDEYANSGASAISAIASTPVN
jgi:hypothetical protein